MADPTERIGKNSGRGARATGNFNRFPDNVGDPSSGGQHYMLITAYEMTDPRMTTQRSFTSAPSSTSTAAKFDPKYPIAWSCALYVPPGSLVQQYDARFSQLEGAGRYIQGAAGTMGGMGDLLGGNFVNAGEKVRKWFSSLEDSWDKNLESSLKERLAESANLIAGQAGNIGRQMMAAGGKARNQHMALVYDGPGEFRTHQFSFTFWPKNADESKQIAKIGKEFRRRMLPGGGNTSSGPHSGADTNNIKSGLFGYPNIFTIKFMNSATGDQFDAMKIYRSVLKTVRMDYMGAQGTVAFHKDGYPVATKMDLTFQETVHVTNDHIQE